ncbi:hypothetical protein MMC15_005604 [Xylographa vitiligo]|nr:hypothetical protein [Xylographa vitiligo]
MLSLSGIALVTFGLANLVSSQTIDPSSVNITVRQTWCTDQMASCPLICLQLPGTSGTPEANTCSATDLSYSCVCSNGVQPNASEYSQTIPYFECTTFNTQCIAACPQGDATCAQNCNTAHPCGAQYPVRVNLTTTTTSTIAATATDPGSASTGTGAAQFTTGLGGSPAPSASGSSTSSSVRAATIGFGQQFGFAVVATGFLAGFTLIL